MSERFVAFVAAARVAGPAMAISFLLGMYLYVEARIGILAWAGIVSLGGLIGFGLGALVWFTAAAASPRIVKTLTSAGDLTPAPSFSYQESLVIRGKIAEARQAYETHLEKQPGDVNARLALARLWRDQLRDAAAAERLFLEARRFDPTEEQELAIANALIDLYHTGGQQGREMAQLARLAARFPDSEPGKRARAALQRMKAEQADS